MNFPSATALRLASGRVVTAPLDATETELRMIARAQGVMFAEMHGSEVGWIVDERFVGCSPATQKAHFRNRDYAFASLGTTEAEGG